MRRKISCLSLILAVMVMLCGCNERSDASVLDDVVNNSPISIRYIESKSGIIESFRADVDVYYMDDRTSSEIEHQGSYRIQTKLIDGIQYSRVDMDGMIPGMSERLSVITNNTEAVVLDLDSGQVALRTSVGTADAETLSEYIDMTTAYSRIDLGQFRTMAARLSLKINEDEGEGKMLLELPSYLLGLEGSRISTKVYFDTVEETIESIETVDYFSVDNSTVTTTIQPLYQELDDGTPIKVGQVTISRTEIPELLEGDWSGMEIYESPDDIPTVSSAELEALMETATVYESVSMIFGDPADLSHTDTMVELYSDISINTVSDEMFRPLI